MSVWRKNKLPLESNDTLFTDSLRAYVQKTMIAVSASDGRPIFKQIVDGIKKQIVTGEMVPGTKLPSVRALAMQLTVNANTIAKAYNELTNMGLIESRKGLGLFVCEHRTILSEEEEDRLLQQAIDTFCNDTMALNVSTEHICKTLKRSMVALNRRADKPKEQTGT